MKFKEMEELKEKLKVFDPKKDDKCKLPNGSGNYIVVLKPAKCLPQKGNMPSPKLSKISIENTDYEVIYTGISSKSLQKRDYSQHFAGHAGKSTLRKSLGCLFGYQLIPRTAGDRGNKSKFGDGDEMELSRWMEENLLLLYYPNSGYDSLETMLIETLNPPLNLQGNNNIVNSDFRKRLSDLRSSKNIKY